MKFLPKGKLKKIVEYIRFLLRDLKFLLTFYFTSKVVVCRPRGGLADSFAQISKCMIYAQAHNRILIVDAVNAGQLQRLNDYFTIHISSARGIKFVNSLNACFPNIRSMTIFPDFKI